MTEKMIDKLRKKFIMISMLSFTLVMMVMGGLIYMANAQVIRKEARETTQYIIDNHGELPLESGEGKNENPVKKTTSADGAEPRQDNVSGQNDRKQDAGGDELDVGQSLEDVLRVLFGRQNFDRSSLDFWYMTRYFSVIYDAKGNVQQVRTSHIASVTDEDAKKYADVALKQFWKFGSIGDYYYQVGDTPEGGKIVVYIDSADNIRMSKRILYVALILITCGVIIAFFILRILSYRIVQPEIRNAEQQKQFITNASHELKTPLAVIRANTEVETMINGENEWNQSTLRQVDRMTGLIQNLVMIARAEEKESGDRTDTDISVLIRDTCDTYVPVINQDGKKLEKNIRDNMHLMADESEIRQLATLLIDNAVKYCDENGTIVVYLGQKGKFAQLSISNSYAEGEKVDYSKFFERFYRQDQSHNVDRGGYGIGLSIAESLVKKYRGSIDASWDKGMITFTCLLRS